MSPEGVMILLPSLAVAAAQTGVPFDCGAGALPIVGIPGLEIHCVFVPPTDGSTWETVRWSFGDLGMAEGDAVSHVYTEPGQYSVILELDGWSPPAGGEDASDPWWPAHGLVNVCGEPEVEFDIVAVGGLEYQLVNRSTVWSHCVSDLLWELTLEDASSDAEPALTFDTWEPRFTFPTEGAWTVSLTVGGIGGTGAAEQQVHATYGLPQLLRDQRGLCAAAPGGLSFGLVALAVACARRKRAPS
jgi:hypothetical protein